MSTRLMLLLYSVVSTTIMGILITAVLSIDMINARTIIAAAVAGLLLSIPASWMIARNITGRRA